MLRDELIERLDRLDEDASLMFDGDERFKMIIVGGGALILLERINRATHDIDAISAPKEIYGLLEKYDINCRVQTYEHYFPYHYQDRIVGVSAGGRKIDFFTASLEDIVIAKLYSVRDTDIRDVDSVADSIDWVLLERLAHEEDEARASAMNDRLYAEFKSNYDHYVMRHRS